MPVEPAALGVVSGLDIEDEAVLLEGLQVAPGARVLSVGSVGERVLALWLAGIDVVCVPCGPQQRALIGLKRATHAVRYLEARQLVGLDRPGRRVFLYHEVRDALEEGARSWWDEREAVVREGVLAVGALDVAAARLRSRLGHVGRGRAWLEQHLARRQAPGGWRFGLTVRVTLQRPEQGATALTARIAELARRAEANRWLDWLLLGDLPHEDGLPRWLSQSGHLDLASRADGWEWREDGLSAPGAGLDGVDLGSFGEESDEVAPLLSRLGDAVRPGGRLVWWTWRHAALEAPAPWRSLAEEERRLSALDRSPFTGALRVWERV